MNLKPQRRNLLAHAVMTSLFFAAPQLVFAQATDGTDSRTSQDEKAGAATKVKDLGGFVVTGSRINSREALSTTPVVTISAESLKLSGTLSVEDYLNTLPQLTAGNTKSSNVFGDSDGTSTLNLRGLGPQRTLVLVNGRRMIGAGPNGVVDLNNIPATMIERVEIITGGGSAVYGSDAMAGVVNFILKDDFEGLTVDAQYGMSGKGDASVRSASATFGSTGERSTGWLSITHEQRDLLRGNKRDLSRYALADSNGTFVRTGSASRPGGTLLAIPTPNGNGGYSNRDYALDNLVPRPYVAATDAFYDATGDYAVQTPLKRTNIFGRSTFNVSDTTTAYLEAGFSHIVSSAALSPTAPNVRQTNNAPAMPANASWISPEIRTLLNARPDPNAPFAVRFLVPDSFPKRQIEYVRDTVRAVGGVKGEFSPTWRWDVSYQFSHLSATDVQRGDVSRRMIVDASTPNPLNPSQCANGNPACSPITSLTKWTPQQVAYLRSDNLSVTTGTQKIFSALVTGDVVELPAGNLATAFGGEYRSESSKDDPGPILRDFISAGYGERGATAGKYDVSEVFGEVMIPLLAKQPYAQYLGIEVAGRYSDYSGAGKVSTYKIGGEWQVNRSILFRSEYQRAARAPNIHELFGGTAQTFPQVIEPCSASANPTGAVAALCVAQGIPASQIGFYQQNGAAITGLLVPNPKLEPEQSNTVTAGLVYSPQWLSGMRVNVDYYDIKIKNAIARLGGGALGTLNACFASLDINSEFCKSFSRSPGNYEIENFRIPLANVGALRSSGVDMSADYRWSLDGFGLNGKGSQMGLAVLVNRTSRNTFQANPSAAVVERVGTVGGDTVAIPQWRANTQLTWASNGLKLIWGTQYLSSVKDRKYANALAADKPNPKAGIAHPTVPSYLYHNLSASYTTGKLTFSGGVRNLFDKGAPLLSSPIEGNTDANTYDVIGRYFYTGVSLAL